ncbi:NADPH:quinone reductase [Microbispora corallina]|uniref:NADPH:quinone reductase n=1 Tax=Microbispora corallina TaxID=83302 RepID=A0ABQ4G363_9ACTN|nr:NADPH:quinone reductase [Microbispora corallina]GIH41474.1 NADPH:quinone reductase [Microbispora corallina]
MRAIVYEKTGDSDVLREAERPVPEPGPGEVRVRVVRSGVNPTDWKSRRGRLEFPEAVPNQDGSGVVDAIGPGVEGLRTGQRVWLWEAAWQRPGGTAQEYVVLPERQAVPLPDGASFDLGASLGIPALTAHRCLTVADGGPDRLAPGALDGRTVLVAGGAGAVGNAAIQLARWAGAVVVTTVSSEEKAALARAAGASHVVNYREEDAAGAIRAAAPDGIDIVVEVAPGPNAGLDAAVLAPDGVVAVYANNGGDEITVRVRELFTRNIRYQFVLVYTVTEAAKLAAVEDVSAAVAAGAIRVGTEAGLPLHRFPLERTAEAHDAVEAGTVGKVLVDVAGDE